MARTPRLALTFFTAAFLIYLFPFAYNLFYKPFFTIATGIDVVPAALLPVTLLEQGDFYLDPFADFIHGNFRDPFFTAAVKDRLVSRYPVAAAVLALPFYGVALGADWLTYPGSSWLTYPQSALFLARLPAAFITALAVMMFFLCARQLTDVKTSAGVTIAFGFGTSVWTTASQALWQHTPGLLFVLIAMWFVLRGERGDPRAIAPGAIFLSAAVVARANHLIAAVIITAFVWLKYRQVFFKWVAWALPPAILFFLYNSIYNGSPFIVGYQEGFAQSISLPRLDGLLGLFLSPSRGLLVYSPFLVFALSALTRPIARSRVTYLLSAAIFALNVMVVSMFKNWDGGWGYGTRLLTDALPFAMLLLIPVLVHAGGLSRLIIFALVIFAVGLQILGLWDYGEHWHWHWANYDYNVWDLRENEPLYYFKQYLEMALQFLNRSRG